jgi:hypothetical protein
MKNEKTNLAKGQVSEHGDLLIVVLAGGRDYQFTDEDKRRRAIRSGTSSLDQE